MGVDLRLLPVESDLGTWGFAHTILSLERNYDVHEAIGKLNCVARPSFNLSTFCGGVVPDGTAKGETMCGVMRETPYGDPLTYIKRSDLVAVLESVENIGPKTRGALAWLRESSVVWVGLYWH